MTARISEPVGCWWGAFDNGEVWPVEVLSITPFGTRVVATHEAAPQGETTLHNSRVYDAEFNRPKKVFGDVELDPAVASDVTIYGAGSV